MPLARSVSVALYRSLGFALVVGAAALARGQNGGVDASAPASSAPVDPRTAEIRALLEGTLDASIEPKALFDVDLNDATAIQIDRVRIRSLLQTLDAKAAPAPPPGVKNAKHKAKDLVTPDAGSAHTELEAIDPARWRARIELDRARLDFYSLDPARRAELLDAQAQRREAARPRETAAARQAREAEAERLRAKAASLTARSEAERAVSEELARLIALEARVAALREQFRARREALGVRRDTVLGWQRRVRDAEGSSSSDADNMYVALRRTLRGSRDELDRALDDFGTATAVPTLDMDRLLDLPDDAKAKALRERRKRVEADIRAAQAEEHAIREQRAASLLDEISALNGERLGLLPHLSPGKRAAITGFSADGWDQARSEARHLVLILRYHRHIALEWISTIRGSGRAELSVWRVISVIVSWGALLFVFIWWRRRSRLLIALGDQRLAAADRSERRVTPSPAREALRIFAAIRRPLEWLLFFEATLWILPAAAQGLLEVQLLSSVIGWSLGSALIVDVINAIAAGSSSTLASESEVAGRLRLRSLRLVGRVAVVFILVLVLSTRLVGKGTLYSWVLSTCWLAALPVFLILVRWWRDTVFERVNRVRKKTALQAWMLANRSGWKSFVAAMVGAVQLFTLGGLKATRNWVASFKLARHADAYLFRRGLDRLNTEKSLRETRPLRASAFESLAPDAPLDEWVACASDEALAGLDERVRSRRGGVIALVGGRGLGKSSALRRLAEHASSVVQVSCAPDTTLVSLRAAIRATQTSAEPAPLILLDDAHTLLKPVVGGLSTFDEVFTHARADSASTLWVFAIDGVLWPFLRRARDSRPLFDEVYMLEPWREEQIGELLERRSAHAGIAPTFEDLLEHLPATADEIDRQDALKARRDGYVRMLWDHVRGNPGLALQAWRVSLVEDADACVRVRSLQVPDGEVLDRLPDAALFILRAVLQLGPVGVADVVQATRFSSEQVVNAFRSGEAHGYLAQRDGAVWVTWRWLREVLSLLERRHLLVNR